MLRPLFYTDEDDRLDLGSLKISKTAKAALEAEIQKKKEYLVEIYDKVDEGKWNITRQQTQYDNLAREVLGLAKEKKELVTGLEQVKQESAICQEELKKAQNELSDIVTKTQAAWEDAEANQKAALADSTEAKKSKSAYEVLSLGHLVTRKVILQLLADIQASYAGWTLRVKQANELFGELVTLQQTVNKLFNDLKISVQQAKRREAELALIESKTLKREQQVSAREEILKIKEINFRKKMRLSKLEDTDL